MPRSSTNRIVEAHRPATESRTRAQLGVEGGDDLLLVVDRADDGQGAHALSEARLAGLVLAHRRSLRKILPELEAFEDWREVMALRLAALFYRSRSDTALPDIRAKAKSRSFRVKVDRDWLKKNPMTVAALREEIEEWAAVGIALEVKVLAEIEAPSDLALVG